MSVEDNTFDFKVRDHMLCECKIDLDLISMHFNPLEKQILIDMIAYCSNGNQEEAVINLKTTSKFVEKYDDARSHPMWNIHAVEFWHYVRGSVFMFEFWRKCFIQTKVAVQKEEPLPRESWHVVMMREYGRFMNRDNFVNFYAFDSEAQVARQSLVEQSDHYNKIYKELC